MASPDRALVAALRAELAAIEPGRACDRAAEVAGLGSATIRGDRPALGRLMARLLRDLRAGSAAGAFDWDGAADHCRAAWLRGRFLARGSLSVASGRLHLEFVVPVSEAEALVAHLGELGLPATARVRRGRGVVTWKGSDSIGTFLRLAGAGATLLELEARQVSRAIRGDLNRLLNAESANLERIALASARQVRAIEALEADGRLAGEAPAVREIARVRRRTPEASLGELAAELQVSRGRVQRALERVETLAMGGIADAGAGRPRRARAERPTGEGPAAPPAGGPRMA